MNKSLATFLAAAGLGLGAHAQSTDAAPAPGTPGTTTSTTVTTETTVTRMVPAPTLSKSQAKDLKARSKADLEARKNLAEANHDRARSDCEASSSGAVERACKADARAQENKDKADAKLIHEQQTQDIDAVTK